MAHHVCPRSSARLIEEVNAFVKIDLSIRKDTKHKAKGTKLIGERASFVPVFRFRANPISTRSLYATIRSQALSNSPVELDKGKKKNTAGTLYYDYTPENETTRARRDFLSSPLFLPSLFFSLSLFRPSSSTDTRLRPGRMSLPLHTANASASSRRNLMDIRAELYIYICN